MKDWLYGCCSTAVLIIAIAVMSLTATAEREMRLWRVEALGEVRNLRGDAAGRVDATLARVDLALAEVGELRRTADRRLASIERNSSNRLDQAIQAGDRRIGGMEAQLARLVDEAMPTLRNVASTSAALDQVARENLYCRGNGNCWPAGVTAALGGAKVFLGEGAQAARRFDQALPRFLDTWDQVGQNSMKASDATAHTMQNLDKATRPLPRWVRIPLGITGAIAPTASGAIAAAAATGAFK